MVFRSGGAAKLSTGNTNLNSNNPDLYLHETANSQTTHYTMDLNAGLTQVLQDGTNTYLYGAGRVARYGAVLKSTESVIPGSGFIRRENDTLPGH